MINDKLLELLDENYIALATKSIIKLTSKFFNDISPTKKAVLGISGGKDSTVAAKLLVEALGKERVIGVSMPNGEQSDIEDVNKVFELLGIKRIDVNINNAYKELLNSVENNNSIELNNDSKINILPRLRMTTLYSIAQTMDALVCNTSNKSEAYIGWCTKWGDNVGDYAILSRFTKTEVQLIGRELGLPDDLVFKEPADGLTGLTDDDNFIQKYGFSYNDLDEYLLRDEECCLHALLTKVDKVGVIDKIAKAHELTEHKRHAGMISPNCSFISGMY